MKYSSLFALIALLPLAIASFPFRVRATPLPLAHTSPLLLAQSNSPFEEGYQLGYSIGWEQGQLFQQERAAYSPQILGVGSNFESKFEQERDRRGAVGYKAGFLAGFHDGYYNDADAGDRGLQNFNAGYERGYETGQQDARECGSSETCRYRPVAIPGQGDEQYQNGYRVGYWQSFEREWGLRAE